MDEAAAAATIAFGMEAVAGDVDLLCLGEMGIGNTTVAAAVYAALFGGSGADWVGRGTGVDDPALAARSRRSTRRSRCTPTISAIPWRCCGALAAARSRRSPAPSWPRACSASP